MDDLNRMFMEWPLHLSLADFEQYLTERELQMLRHLDNREELPATISAGNYWQLRSRLRQKLLEYVKA